MRTIQRTPNIGLVIRMVRLAVAEPYVRPSFAPVDPPDEPEEPVYPPDPGPDPEFCPPTAHDVYGAEIPTTDAALAWGAAPPLVMMMQNATLSLRADGTLWYAGETPNDGSFNPDGPFYSTGWAQIGTDTDWASIIGLGSFRQPVFAHLLKTDGSLWFLGHDWSLGLAGNGQEDTGSATPVMADAGPWKCVVLSDDSYRNGNFYLVGVKEDGTLWSWGQNRDGQLGLGDVGYTATPTQIGTDTDWVGAYASLGVCFAVKASGQVWAWGDNYYGQITATSNGTVISTPVLVG